MKSLARAVYHRLYRFQIRMRCWLADRAGRSEPTVPPAMLRFRVTESLSVKDFLKIGEGCAQHIGQRLFDGFSQGQRVLDFGCGCGRTIRWLLRDHGGVEFHGADVDADAIEWCKAHLQGAQFLTTAPEPPLPYPDAHFDAIYCLSVFTHLDEAMQDLWLAELSRLLKPGGVLLLSVHGVAAAKQLDPAGRDILANVGFLHRRTRKLKGLVPDWYQTTWHSQEYILNRLSRSFEDPRYDVVPDGLQDFVTARKPTQCDRADDPEMRQRA
jgi:SAM-dependent methyltransferase